MAWTEELLQYCLSKRGEEAIPEAFAQAMGQRWMHGIFLIDAWELFQQKGKPISYEEVHKYMLEKRRKNKDSSKEDPTISALDYELALMKNIWGQHLTYLPPKVVDRMLMWLKMKNEERGNVIKSEERESTPEPRSGASGFEPKGSGTE